MWRDNDQFGWGKSPKMRKYHYFPKGEVMAVCRGWMYGGELEPSAVNEEDCCKKCWGHVNAKGRKQD